MSLKVKVQTSKRMCNRENELATSTRFMTAPTTISKKCAVKTNDKQMSFIFLKVLVIRTKPILVKQKNILQLGLGSIFL